MPAHHAVIHDDIQAGRPGPPGGRFVDDAVLQPHRAGLDRDSLLHDRPHELRPSKNIDHIDRVGDIT